MIEQKSCVTCGNDASKKCCNEYPVPRCIGCYFRIHYGKDKIREAGLEDESFQGETISHKPEEALN